MDKINTSREKALLNNLKFLRPYEPKHLYKYRTISSKGLDETFTKQSIYLCCPLLFNDPWDCYPVIKPSTSAYKTKKLVKSMVISKFPAAGKRKVNKEVQKVLDSGKLFNKSKLNSVHMQFISGIGVYSLTEKNDSLLMWSHYADSLRGFCLEFKAAHSGLIFWQVLKVQYQSNRPEIEYTDIGKPDSLAKLALTKPKEWEYEQ